MYHYICISEFDIHGCFWDHWHVLDVLCKSWWTLPKLANAANRPLLRQRALLLQKLLLLCREE